LEEINFRLKNLKLFRSEPQSIVISFIALLRSSGRLNNVESWVRGFKGVWIIQHDLTEFIATQISYIFLLGISKVRQLHKKQFLAGRTILYGFDLALVKDAGLEFKTPPDSKLMDHRYWIENWCRTFPVPLNHCMASHKHLRIIQNRSWLLMKTFPNFKRLRNLNFFLKPLKNYGP